MSVNQKQPVSLHVPGRSIAAARILRVASALLLLLAIPLPSIASGAAGPLLASSDFDFDDNGWTYEALAGPAPGPAPHVATGGAPRGRGGFVEQPDSGFGFFVAPAQFLGDKADASGGTIRFHARGCVRHTIYLQSGETRLLAKAALDPGAATDWTEARVPFEPSVWRWDDDSLVTTQELACALAHLEGIRIALHNDGSSSVPSLDRVRLTAPRSAAKGKAKPAILDFGEVTLGDTVTLPILITNSGTFGKARVLHLRFHNVPDEIEITAPAKFCGVILHGSSISFQAAFKPTKTGDFDQFIILNTGTTETPRFARIRAKARVVAPGSTILGTWFQFGFAQFPVNIVSAGRDTYEVRWTDTDIDHTVNVLRGTMKGNVWKGTWTWTVSDFTEKGTFSVTRSSGGPGGEELNGSAHSRQGAITVGLTRNSFR